MMPLQNAMAHEDDRAAHFVCHFLFGFIAFFLDDKNERLCQKIGTASCF